MEDAWNEGWRNDDKSLNQQTNEWDKVQKNYGIWSVKIRREGAKKESKKGLSGGQFWLYTVQLGKQKGEADIFDIVTVSSWIAL